MEFELLGDERQFLIYPPPYHTGRLFSFVQCKKLIYDFENMDDTSNFKEILNCDEVCNYLAKCIKTCSKKYIKVTFHCIFLVWFYLCLFLLCLCVSSLIHILLCLLVFEAGSVIYKSRVRPLKIVEVVIIADLQNHFMMHCSKIALSV